MAEGIVSFIFICLIYLFIWLILKEHQKEKRKLQNRINKLEQKNSELIKQKGMDNWSNTSRHEGWK